MYGGIASSRLEGSVSAIDRARLPACAGPPTRRARTLPADREVDSSYATKFAFDRLDLAWR